MAFRGYKPEIRSILGYTSSPESRSHILVPMPTTHQVSPFPTVVSTTECWLNPSEVGATSTQSYRWGHCRSKRGEGTASWQVAAGLELELRTQILGECSGWSDALRGCNVGSHNSVDTTTRLPSRAQLLPRAPMVMWGIPPEHPHLLSPLPSLGVNNPDPRAR